MRAHATNLAHVTARLYLASYEVLQGVAWGMRLSKPGEVALSSD